MLFGIKDSTGLGNNADELNEAFELLMDSVINPKQLYLTDAFEEIANAYGVNLNLAFKPLRTIVKEEPQSTTLSLSKEDKNLQGVADALINLGENIDLDKYELIDEIKANNFDLKENQLNNIVQFASVPRANNVAKSKQDTSLFLVRYAYAGRSTGEREFCDKVLKANKVYRYEDLENASKKPVNAGLGLGGADTYNIAFYKGGVNCKHFWQRKIYLKKDRSNLDVNKARKMILALDPSERKDAMWKQNDKKVAQIADSSNNFWKAN